MVGAELVTEFMGHVIDIKCVADRGGQARYASRLGPRLPDHAQVGHAATPRAEHVTDIVVRVSYHRVDGGLVLTAAS